MITNDSTSVYHIIVEMIIVLLKKVIDNELILDLWYIINKITKICLNNNKMPD